MWILQAISTNDEKSFCILSGNEYQVGRKDCVILLQNDASISRKHAVIRMEESNGVLTDFSKYGTFVNNVKVNREASLKHNDSIQFGQSQHRFRLLKNHLVITTSCINSRETKGAIRTIVKRLGGDIVKDWTEECTHLVMESVTFTIKAVCALASISPIVTPKFFDDLSKACEAPGEPIPKAEMYLPTISETSLKDNGDLFAPNVERKLIFIGKRVVFLSQKQFKRLAPAITMTGGSVELQEHLGDSFKRECSSDNVIVIAPELKDEEVATTTQKEMIFGTISYLNELGLRAIKESEIGLAILHLSLDDHCNPRKISDDSIAGTTSSQIIHETIADFTSQWQMTSRTVNPKSLESAKPKDVLVDDSQANFDKKRKRSSETSMYITDTVPVDGASAFQAPKRPNRRNSSGESNQQKEEKVKPIGETAEHSNSKCRNEEVIGDATRTSKAGDNNKDDDVTDDVIDELANSILEDDDNFGEDLFALDTEKNHSRRSRREEASANSKITCDKSRITETQPFCIDDDSRSGVATEIVKKSLVDRSDVFESQQFVASTRSDVALHTAEESPKTKEQSGVLDSQPLDDGTFDRCENRIGIENKPKIEEKKIAGPVEEAVTRSSAKFHQEDRANVYVPPGFKNSKREKSETDIIRDPDEPIASTIIGFSDLVVRKKGNIQQPIVYDSNVKNFKKFRKAYFPGNDRSIPRIIGGRDLLPYESANAERDRMFAEFNAINNEREREAKDIDAIFKMDMDTKSRRRRK